MEEWSTYGKACLAASQALRSGSKYSLTSSRRPSLQSEALSRDRTRVLPCTTHEASQARKGGKKGERGKREERNLQCIVCIALQTISHPTRALRV
jgi:hypothetical protein